MEAAISKQVEYPGQVLTDAELLTIQRQRQTECGWMMQTMLGTSTVVTGLACTPNSPAAMNVLVGPGTIYSLQNLDTNPYGSLGADTTTANQIVKQGLSLGSTTLACPAPATSGQSIVYLIEAAYQDYDTNSQVLSYYDASNPTVAWVGPGNTGAAQNTTRQSLCALQVKAGVAAPTGSQTVPATDSGFTALYTVTVAYGQTSITSGNIAVVSGAPFLTATIPSLAAQIGQSVSGAGFRNLKITNGPTPNTTVALTADSVVLENPSGATVKFNNVSLTINLATTGSNGLDTGSLAANTWYAIWIQASSTSGTGLASTSGTAPVLSAGCTFKLRCGWMRTDGSGNLYRTLQYGRLTQYVATPSTNTPVFPVLASGTQGGYAAVNVSGSGGMAPPTASVGRLYIYPTSATSGGASVATNASGYGLMGQFTFTGTNAVIGAYFEMLLESSNVYYDSTSSAVVLTIAGWEDNL